jgi:hypothetical protein
MGSPKQRDKMSVETFSGGNVRNLRKNSLASSGCKAAKNDCSILILEGDNGVIVHRQGQLRVLEGEKTASNLLGQALEVWPAKADVPALAETPEGEEDVFVGPIRYIVGGVNGVSVEF